MFQTIADYENDPAASEAEKGLIEACRMGQGWSINDGTLPDEDNTDPNITVRADLIRLLALQATSLHESGVELKGALITGTLDLRFAKCRGRLVLRYCWFAEKLIMTQAELVQLSLEGSQFPGLSAQEVKVTGSIVLSGVKSTGTVNVSAAQIGGQFNCNGANLNGGDGHALHVQMAKVMGSVFFQDVIASGTTDLNGAKIGGQITFKGAVLDGKGKLALEAQSLRVESEFIFFGVKSVKGLVDLQSAQVRDLADDAASWKECKGLILDGFTYDRISGSEALKTFAARKDWLEMGSRFEGEFRPQPYTQCAKVMRAMGHATEARRTMMGARQAASKHFRGQTRIKNQCFRAVQRLNSGDTAARVADVTRVLSTAEGDTLDALAKVLAEFNLMHLPWPTAQDAPTPPDAMTMGLARRDFRNQMLVRAAKGRLDIGVSWLKDWLSRHVIGYGYEPHRAIITMLAMVVPSAMFFSYAYAQGAMVPDSDVILTSFSWFGALLMDGQAPTSVWDDGAVARHYETFYALAYAFDVFVPIVDLGQQSAWTATTVSWLGWYARMVTMALEVLGWIVSALAAASVTGLVQRNVPD